MSYIRFGLMILTSTVVMFALMYLNTYAFEHLFFSETRAYMAVVMGASMAVIMLAFMLGMYTNKRLNLAIFVSAILAFAIFLWLVRSQVTVSGPSYMRAMIPHHSIAVMTSERAQIRDPRVRRLADEIIAAQRKEIAEMHYLIAEVSAGRTVDDIYEDPAARAGTVQDALANTVISQLDLAGLPKAEANRVLPSGDRCAFHRSLESDPILWTAAGGSIGVVKLNGILVELDAEPASGRDTRYSTRGMQISVRSLGDDADWRSDSELVFNLEAGLGAGYRGFYACERRAEG